MGRDWVPGWFISKLSALRNGDWTDDLADAFMACMGLGLHSRAIVGSAKVCRVVDIRHDHYLQKGFLSTLDSKLGWVNALQTSLNDWFKGGCRTLMYSFWHAWVDGKWRDPPEEPKEASIPSYTVVVSAVILLSLVYQYLTGNVDKGGSKAYSRSSLDFRDMYVAIVLFLGAYVWIKFREVAFRGVHRRELVDKQGGVKVVYEARLKPPLWNRQKVPRLHLGQFATAQEAHKKFLIAAFYYNRGAGLLDGWFQVPSMNEEEQSLIGEEKRKWVIGQAKKVYEDFKKGAKVEAALVQELLDACEGQVTQESAEVNVDPCGTSLLNSAEPQQLVCVSQVENSGMGMAMLDYHGLECASHSFDGMHEGLALSNGHNFGFQGGSALPVSHLPPITESGMSMNSSDQLDFFQTCVQNQQLQISDQQQQIYLQQQQISDQQQQISLQQQQIQGFAAQILQLQHQQRIPQQQLLESKIQNPQWPYPFCLQEQLQDVNLGVPSSAVEMEQSIYQ